MLENARGLLVQELALARGLGEETVGQEIEKLFEV
jgi:hypothetical protein